MPVPEIDLPGKPELATCTSTMEVSLSVRFRGPPPPAEATFKVTAPVLASTVPRPLSR